MSTRCGIGYDLHRLVEGRKLIIGGIEVPFEKGPAGHSDGDVVAHAVCDALLGAAGLGDIGKHFPDTDPKWKGANSLLFLEHAQKLLNENKFAIEHIDVVVILERPKLGPHFPKMREALAKSLECDRGKGASEGQDQRRRGRGGARRSDCLSRGRDTFRELTFMASSEHIQSHPVARHSYVSNDVLSILRQRGWLSDRAHAGPYRLVRACRIATGPVRG